MSTRFILPRCPQCRAFNQAIRCGHDYMVTDDFWCQVCGCVWREDPNEVSHQVVLKVGTRPVFVDDPWPSRWTRLKRWFRKWRRKWDGGTK